MNYADTQDVMLTLEGLPPDEQGTSLLLRPQVSRQLYAESMRYATQHSKDLEEIIANCLGI